MVNGNFEKADVVSIADLAGNIFAQGITRFSSSELDTIKGMSKDEVVRQFPERNDMRSYIGIISPLYSIKILNNLARFTFLS